MDSRLTHRLRLAVGGIVVLTIAVSAIGFRVDERTASLVTRFGKPVRVVERPGLHWKLPWPLEKATAIDLRRRVFDTRHTEMLTRDKKNVVLLSYAVWKVADPLKFHRAIGSIDAGDAKLDGLVTNAKIGVLGRYDLTALVSTDPQTLRMEAIEQEILAAVRDTAADSYGIDVSEVGFKRLSLPEANVEQVFEQMRAERARFAARNRAEGNREATRIRADTDVEKAEILAAAEEQAARLRGEAEAEAARIYAEAHRSDPELYEFLRQLESLEKVISARTSLILRTDSEPFGLLKEKPGP